MSSLAVVVSISRHLEEGEAVEYDEVSDAAAGAMSADGDEGKWILFSLAILMSWCFLVVAAAMGYYSWKEDRLLLRYQREGVIIPGQVSNIVLLREGSSNTSSVKKKKAKKTKMASGEEKGDDGTASLSYSDEKHESVRSDVPYAKSSTYLVAIKYNVELAPGYSTGIIKWARLQGDVLPRSLFYRTQSSLIGMTVLFKSKFSLNLSKNQNLLQTPTQQEKSSDDTSLPLLLIKGFPLGAHPRSAIIKSRSISSRLVSTSIVAFFTIFGALTHYLAVHIAYAEDITTGFSENFARILARASMSFLCILAFVMFVVVRFLDKQIDAVLKGEYTERGEYATKAGDKTYDYTVDTLEMACRTFSTRSDIFLTLGRNVP